MKASGKTSPTITIGDIMIRWLRNLLGLCNHRWVIIDKIAIISSDHNPNDTNVLTSGTKYHLQSEKCGAVMSKRL